MGDAQQALLSCIFKEIHFRTRSFPILVHYIEEALHSRGFYIGDEVADLLTDSRYGHEDRPSRKTSNESAMSDVVMDDADVKIGEAWLPRSAPSGRVAKPRAMYVMEMDKGAGMSLLASMKEVDEFEELIPPAPVPLRMRNIHSRPSVDVGQRLSRASTTETRQTLDNAYSDLVRTIPCRLVDSSKLSASAKKISRTCRTTSS